jgi:hypothetical protein
MSNNPFENNPNYQSLFKISSNANACSIIEKVELYKHKTKPFYILFRYMIDNMTMPVRTLLKLTDLLQTEVLQTANRAELYITTGYKDLSITTNRVNIACGSLPYVLQVEKAMYENLL